MGLTHVSEHLIKYTCVQIRCQGTVGRAVQSMRRPPQRGSATAAGMPARRRVGGLGGQPPGPPLSPRSGPSRRRSDPSGHGLRRKASAGRHLSRQTAAKRRFFLINPGSGRLERPGQPQHGPAVAHGRPDPPPSLRPGGPDSKEAAGKISGLTGGAARAGGKRPLGSVSRCP